MEKIPAFDSNQRNVIKTFFSLKQSLASLREIPGGVLETTSIEELYNLVIETVDLLVYSRYFVLEDYAQRNPRVKQVTPSFENVGGISMVRVRSNIVVSTDGEIARIRAIQMFLINMRNSLLNRQPLPNLSSVEKQIKKETIGRNQDHKKSKRHFYNLRK